MSSPFFKHKVLPVIINHGQNTSSSNNNGAQEVEKLPNFDIIKNHGDKIGHLKKLVGRGLLSAGTWKDRMVVLYQNQLILYETTELSSTSPNSGSESTTTFSYGAGTIIPLVGYDIVTEAPTRVTRKAANVFLLGRSDKGFFDTSCRHYFAAKSLTEMKDWVSKLRKILPVSGIPAQSSSNDKGKENCQTSPNKSNNKKQKMGNGDSPNLLTAPAPEGQSEESSSPIKTLVKNMGEEQQSGTSGDKIMSSTLPRGGSHNGPSPGSSNLVDVEITKSRIKGPIGRRLPRSRSPRNIDQFYPHHHSHSNNPHDEFNSSSSISICSSSNHSLVGQGMDFRDGKGRATSLSALEFSAETTTPATPMIKLRPTPENRLKNRNHRSSSTGSGCGNSTFSTKPSKGLVIEEGHQQQLGNFGRNGESYTIKSFDNENFSRSRRTNSTFFGRNGQNCNSNSRRNSRYLDLTSSEDSGDDTVEEKNMTVVGPKENLLEAGNNTNALVEETLSICSGTSRAIPGPQVKAVTPNSLRLSRRSAGTGNGMIRGGTPVRNNSLTSSSTTTMSTPPPCLLRKLRREMSQERNTSNTNENEQKSDDNSNNWKRRSITISTDDETNKKHTNNSPFLSLRRSSAHHCQNSNRVSLPQQIGQFIHKHGTMSETASPIINGRYYTNLDSYNNKLNGHNNGKTNGRSLQQLAPIPHPLESSIDEIKNEISTLNQDTRKIDLELAFLREDVGCVHENISDLKGTVENTREKVTRITVQLANAERQIGAAVKEANVLREESFKLLQSAQSSKETQEQLTTQIENLFEYLKSFSTKYCSPAAHVSNPKNPCFCSMTNLKVQNGNIAVGDCESNNRLLTTIQESPSSCSIVSSNNNCQGHSNNTRWDSNSELNSNSSDNDGDSSSIIEKATYHKSS